MAPIIADLLLVFSLVAPALAAPQPTATCAPGYTYVPGQASGSQSSGPWCEKFVTVTEYVTVYQTVNAGSGAQRLQPTTEAELKTSTILGTVPTIPSSSVRAGTTSSLASVTRTLTVVLETTSSTHVATSTKATTSSKSTSTVKPSLSSQTVARANPSSVSVGVSASVSAKASTSTLSLTRVSSSSSSKQSTSTAAPFQFSTSIKPTTSSKATSTSTQAPFQFSTSIKPTSTIKPTTASAAKTSTSTSKAVPTTTTSKAAAAASAIPIVAHNGKRGLAYNTVQYTLPFATFPKVSWAYNWYSATGLQSGTVDATTFGANFKYAPMLWSNASDLESVWNSNVQQSIQYYGTDAVLAFNEPDGCYGGGSCMDVPSAVRAWKQYMQPLAGKVRLGAPAVTNGGSPMGLTWLTQFIAQCTGCTIDFVPLHYYGDGYWPAGLTQYISGAYQTLNKPIWVTEFGIANSVPDSQVATFLEDAMSFFDSASYVERYAFFWDGPGAQTLINTTTGQPSALGQLYGTF